jgi:catechol 2,3-dioxygenase-like lactoylglutathione lyase family enzyme
MTLHSFTHVALRVARLREAEEFYRTLFGLDVAFREAETPEGWATLSATAEWDEAERAGIELELVMLYRDGLRLALEAADSVALDGQLSHVGVFVDEDELGRLRAAAADAGCRIASDRQQALIFDDPFGVRWEVNTFPYEDPPSLSTGARTGHWLEVTPPRGENEATDGRRQRPTDDQTPPARTGNHPSVATPAGTSRSGAYSGRRSQTCTWS